MEKSPLKLELIQEAEGNGLNNTLQYVKYRNFLMGLSEEKRRYFFYSSEKSVAEFLDSFENLSKKNDWGIGFHILYKLFQFT